MIFPRTSLALLVLGAWLATTSALAEGWSLGKLAPCGSTQKSNPTEKGSTRPSVWQRMHTGTREFFGNVGKALTPNKSASTPKPSRQHVSSVKPAKKAKKSLFGSWFGPKESEPPRSLREWMDLEPIRP